MIKKRFMLRAFLVLAMVLSGCGYTLSNGGYLRGNVTRVAVIMFENQSSESGAETTFTSALMKEILQKSGTRIVAKNEADAVITGTIRSISTSVLSRTSDDEVVKRQVSAVIDLDMVDTRGERIWSVHNFSANEDFTVEDSNVSDETSKADAIEKIADRVSERIIDRMRDRF